MEAHRDAVKRAAGIAFAAGDTSKREVARLAGVMPGVIDQLYSENSIYEDFCDGVLAEILYLLEDHETDLQLCSRILTRWMIQNKEVIRICMHLVTSNLIGIDYLENAFKDFCFCFENEKEGKMVLLGTAVTVMSAWAGVEKLGTQVAEFVFNRV